MYKIKEIYYTIQGEGAQTGRPSVFVRFSGCNLWSGREEDRHKAVCKFCDTDFWGTDGENGGRYSAASLRDKILDDRDPLLELRHHACRARRALGEPALQVDPDLISVLHKANIQCSIETNGTLPLPDGIDWVCVSPKAGTTIVIEKGNELKLVYPQEGLDPTDFENLDFDHFYIQPLHNENIVENTNACIAYCKANPKWSLSIQTHKLLNIP